MTSKEFSEALSQLQQAWETFSKAVNNFSLTNEPEKDKKVNLNLDVTLYTELVPYNSVTSKGRVRIFYTGLNRNRTFISEDFAKQLIESLPYTPVKGIFNKDNMDFEDHGEDNADGRIYGLVMENPNFAWEDHLDDDGVTRTYACADVLYFTGLYPEAKLIPGCSQSMEIYANNLQGEWRVWEDGDPYYHFIKGNLLGLQVLGMDVEPCFEGAAFFNLQEDLKELIKYMKNINKKEESADMEKTLFRLSDNEKASALATALNPNFNEEGNWEMSACLLDVYDDYALFGDIATGGYKRVYYTKDGDNITIGETVDVQIVDVTSTEYAALEAMKSIGGTYEAVNTAYNDATAKITELESSLAEAETKYQAEVEKVSTLESNMAAKTTDFEAKIAEKDEAIETAATTYATLETEKVRVESEKADLITERDSLLEFKKNIETEKKQAILLTYTEHLTDSAIKNFTDSMEDYSVEDFEKEVCVAAVKNSPSIFSKNEESNLIYKGLEADKTLTGVERLLEKHMNKGGNK